MLQVTTSAETSGAVAVEQKNLPENLPHLWRERATKLRSWGADEATARIWETAGAELEQALQTAGGETLTLTEAARLSGLTPGYLGDLIRAGKLPNAGRKHAPRLRRSDLPVKRQTPAHLPQHGWSRSDIVSIADRLR